MADTEIRHSGRIVEITPEVTTVEIISESACASCHASALCSLSESKKKEIQVPSRLGYELGEEVWVILKRTMGLKAVWVAYALPLLVLVAVLLAASACGAGELVAGLCGIGAVALYYFVIFLLRNRLKNEYTFYIKKK